MQHSSLFLRSGLAIASLLCTMTCTVVGEEVRWSTDIEKSLQEASRRNTPLLMEFTASWCGYCKKMEASTFTDPVLSKRINSQFIPVQIDADKHADLVKHLQIKGLPAILVVAPDMSIIESISGYQTADALTRRLDQVQAVRAQAEAIAASQQNPRAITSQPVQAPAQVQAPAFDAVMAEQPAPSQIEADGFARVSENSDQEAAPSLDLFQGIPEAQATRVPNVRKSEPSPSIQPSRNPVPMVKARPAGKTVVKSSDQENPFGSSENPFAQPASLNDPAISSDNPFQTISESQGNDPTISDESAEESVFAEVVTPTNSAKTTAERSGAALAGEAQSSGTQSGGVQVSDRPVPVPAGAYAASAAAFNSVCLVSAVEDRDILKGSSEFALAYRNRILFFRTQEHMARFMVSPDKYWPMLDGICSVTLAETGRRIQGDVQFAAVFRKRVWFFSSQECMKAFLEDPAEMVEEALEQL